MTLAGQQLRPTPQSYSYQATTHFFRPDPVVLQVNRAQNSTVIEFNVSSKGFNSAKPNHKLVFLDLSSHLIHIQDEAGCRTFRNSLDTAPSLLDPVNGTGIPDLGAAQTLRREVVNGLPARLVQIEGAKVWLARDYDFPLRQVTPAAESTPQNVELDVRQLVLKTPPAARLAAPIPCADVDPAAKPLGLNHDEGWDEALRLQASPLRLPRIYSMRVRHDKEVRQIDRNQQLEAVVIQEGKQRRRVVFDFERHRASVEEGTSCREIDYSAPVPPFGFDPTTAEELQPLVETRVRVLRWETLRGLRTRLVENSQTAGPFVEYFWLPEQYDFPLRYAFRLTLEPQRGVVTAWEVEQIQFTSPSKEALEFPKACQAMLGTIGALFEGWPEFYDDKR